MKYSILLCLLLVLVNSKIEPKSFLTKVIKNFSEDEDYGDEDDDLCYSISGKKECRNTLFPEKDLMCCYLSAKVEEFPQEEGGCIPMPTVIDLFSDLASLTETKAIVKEVFGYYLYHINKEEIPEEYEEFLAHKANINLQCKNLDFSYNYEPYTGKEKTILKSDSHCLQHISSSINDDEPPMLEDGTQCENFLLLESSEKAGVECGYLNIFAQKGNDTDNNITLSTCMFFNEKVLKKIFETDLIKKLIKEAKKKAEEEVKNPENLKSSEEDEEYPSEKGEDYDDDDEEISKITVEFRNGEGKTFSYTYDSSVPDEINNNSCLIAASKFLFLFILFLF